MFYSERITTFETKTMKSIFCYLFCCVVGMGLLSCSARGGNKPLPQPAVADVPVFDSDSAYAYVQRQVAFGPRVPNRGAHRACAEYLAEELRRHGADVEMQEALLRAYDGTELRARNIIGVFSPEKKDRILLFAHWDSRPYADRDSNPDRRNMPIDGADDGASGVGVLLEIARQIGQHAPRVGVDILFCDAEDYGVPEWSQSEAADSWALGTQYWTRRPHRPGYRARYGILLDMVGGAHSKFFREGVSKYYASSLVRRIWSTAARIGYGDYFVDSDGGYVTDDHVYVNRMGIPSVDIIAYNPDTESGFPPYWHTHDDTMKNIDRATLKAVGQTVLTVIYEE